MGPWEGERPLDERADRGARPDPAFGLAASAQGAVRCVGSSGGDCASSHTTINAAVGAATDGADTIRIAAGTYDEAIDTPKVLTFEGAGGGTLDRHHRRHGDQAEPPPNSTVAPSRCRTAGP